MPAAYWHDIVAVHTHAVTPRTECLPLW
jgi:hypothetical protein